MLICNATYYCADGCALSVVVYQLLDIKHLVGVACVTIGVAVLQVLALVLNGPGVLCVP